MARNNIFKNIDGQLTLIMFVLIVIGLVNVFSSQYNESSTNLFSLNTLTTNFGKQLIWFGFTLIFFFIILIIDVRFFINFSNAIYFVAIGMLIITYIFGREVSGTRGWFSIGGFNLQASEIAKFATALAVAKYIDNYQFRMDNRRDLFMLFGIIALPVMIIMLQNDFGSALVFTSFIIVLFRQGLSPWLPYLSLASAVLFLMVLLLDVQWTILILVVIALLFYLFTYKRKKALIVTLLALGLSIGFVSSVNYIFDDLLQPHQKSRVNVLLGKEVDLKGSGYNVHQSLIAIGSGGFNGKGFLKGTQTKLNFVPEQSTDFIFCTIAEEYGFIGSVVLILLFAWLLIRILYLSEKQKLKYARVYGYCVASILFFHFTLNIAMTLGIFPVIGIPLPFISYGGSALLGFVILITIFIKLDADYKHYFN